jgi:hypothetical protein
VRGSLYAAAVLLFAAAVSTAGIVQTRAAGASPQFWFGPPYVFLDEGTSPTDYIDTFRLMPNGASYDLSLVNSTATPGQFSTAGVNTISTAPVASNHSFCLFHIARGSADIESYSFNGSLKFVNSQTLTGGNLQVEASYLFVGGLYAMQIQSGCILGPPSSPPCNCSFGNLTVPSPTRAVVEDFGTKQTIDVYSVSHPTASTTTFSLLKQNVPEVPSVGGITSTTFGAQTLVFISSATSPQLEGDVLNPSTGALTPMPGSPAALGGPPSIPFVPPGYGFVTAAVGGSENYMEDFSFNGGQLSAGHVTEMSGTANEPTAQASIANILFVASYSSRNISMCDLGPLGGVDYCVDGASEAHTGGDPYGIGVDYPSLLSGSAFAR